MRSSVRDLLSPEDLRTLQQAGFGQRAGFGERPAILVIDAQNYMIGEGEGATEDYPSACGESGERALQTLEPLLVRARSVGAPVVFTRFVLRSDGRDIGQYGRKRPFRVIEGWAIDGTIGAKLSPLLTVTDADFVYDKAKPSAFFGTPLLAMLIEHGIDTVIIAGGSTSNCVRATAVDSFSYNFRTIVIEDCVFDRFDISHRTTLFDLDRQYADVATAEEVAAYLDQLGS